MNKQTLPLSIISKIEASSSQEEALDYLDDIRNDAGKRPSVLSFINAHGYNLCFKEKEFASIILQSDVVFRDGVGMEILFKYMNKIPGANLNGTDLIPLILDKYLGSKIALLGTKEPYLSQAVNLLESKGHNIVLQEDGFKDQARYISLIETVKPDIIILGMGMPKQEKIAWSLKQKLNFPCLIINGGAIIDFMGNKVRRAPNWVRRFKVEWLYRFLQEPRRLFRRYVIGNFHFFLRMVSMNYTRGRAV